MPSRKRKTSPPSIIFPIKNGRRRPQLFFLVILGIFLGASIIVFTLYFLIGSWKPTENSISFLPRWLGNHTLKESKREIVLLSKTLKVPADNKTILPIEAKIIDREGKAYLPFIPIQGKIEKGAGKLSKIEKEGENSFQYQAGGEIGEVTLLFTAGKLSKELVITLVNPQPPAPPTILKPQNEEVLENFRPTVTGNSSPNTEVLVFVDGNLAAKTQSGADGTFKLALPQPLLNGSHQVWAISKNIDEVASSPSNRIEFQVKTPKTEIYLQQIRTLPKQIKAGQDFYLFLPTSLNTKEAYLLLEEKKYKLRNPNLSGIFSRLLRAPQKTGRYPLSFYLVDEAGNKTYFNEAYLLHIH